MTPIEPQRRKLTSAVVPALAAAGLAGLAALFVVGRQASVPDISGAPPPPGCIVDGAETVGGPISLLDVNGSPVTEADFSSGPAIVYFGFTHCPDICPTTLYALAEALALPGGFDVQPIMITVDPIRDTPAAMRAYVGTEGFPAGLVGLSGSEAQLEPIKRAFGVVARQSPRDGTDDYSVDHTSFLYVMDETWTTRSRMLSVGASPADIAACISAGLSRPH